jgi:hypothetical protein
LDKYFLFANNKIFIFGILKIVYYIVGTAKLKGKILRFFLIIKDQVLDFIEIIP